MAFRVSRARETRNRLPPTPPGDAGHTVVLLPTINDTQQTVDSRHDGLPVNGPDAPHSRYEARDIYPPRYRSIRFATPPAVSHPLPERCVSLLEVREQ